MNKQHAVFGLLHFFFLYSCHQRRTQDREIACSIRFLPFLIMHFRNSDAVGKCLEHPVLTSAGKQRFSGCSWHLRPGPVILQV